MDIFPKTGWMNLPISLLERYGFSHSELLPISTCYFIYTRYIRYIHVTYKLYITYVFHTIFYMNELYLNHLHHLLAGSVGPLPKLSLINCGRLAGSLLIEPATVLPSFGRFCSVVFIILMLSGRLVLSLPCCVTLFAFRAVPLGRSALGAPVLLSIPGCFDVTGFAFVLGFGKILWGGSSWICPFVFPLNSSMVGSTIAGMCFVLVGALISSKNGVLPPVMNFSKSRLL